MIGPAILPPGMLPMGAEIVTVDVHCIEKGDRLVGGRNYIEKVLYHGNGEGWLLVDQFGGIIAKRPLGARVQVLRGGLTSDDTPAQGIERPTCESCGDEAGVILPDRSTWCTSCDATARTYERPVLRLVK